MIVLPADVLAWAITGNMRLIEYSEYSTSTFFTVLYVGDEKHVQYCSVTSK